MAFERLKKFLDEDGAAHYSLGTDRIYVGNDAFFAVIDLKDWGWGEVPTYCRLGQVFPYLQTDLYKKIYEGMTDSDVVTDYFYLKLKGLEYLVARGKDKIVAVNAKFARLIPGLSPEFIYDEEKHTNGIRFLVMYSRKAACHMWIAQVKFPGWVMDKVTEAMDGLRGDENERLSNG